jgi:NADPH:quinone reductase-like Zn-dependent oxidoreductase
VGQGSVKPLIDSTYTFTEAATAHRRLLQHQNTGKVVLKP